MPDSPPTAPRPAPGSASASEACARVVRFYECLQASDLDQLDALYSADARFKDPFNEVQGVAAIRHIFEHMFVQVEQPHFVVTERLVDGQAAFLVWDFRFRFKRKGQQPWQTVRGATHLRFAPDGRVSEHRDYWDAAEELYEKLPLLGGLMRWVKKRVG